MQQLSNKCHKIGRPKKKKEKNGENSSQGKGRFDQVPQESKENKITKLKQKIK
jgi:hypothetical protein